MDIFTFIPTANLELLVNLTCWSTKIEIHTVTGWKCKLHINTAALCRPVNRWWNGMVLIYRFSALSVHSKLQTTHTYKQNLLTNLHINPAEGCFMYKWFIPEYVCTLQSNLEVPPTVHAKQPWRSGCLRTFLHTFINWIVLATTNNVICSSISVFLLFWVIIYSFPKHTKNLKALTFKIKQN